MKRAIIFISVAFFAANTFANEACWNRYLDKLDKSYKTQKNIAIVLGVVSLAAWTIEFPAALAGETGAMILAGEIGLTGLLGSSLVGNNADREWLPLGKSKVAYLRADYKKIKDRFIKKVQKKLPDGTREEILDAIAVGFSSGANGGFCLNDDLMNLKEAREFVIEYIESRGGENRPEH